MDQGVALAARAGMDGQAGRLVDDRDVRVFIHHREDATRWGERGRRGLLDGHGERVASKDAPRGPWLAVWQPNLPCFDQSLSGGACHAGEQGCQGDVEARAIEL